MKAIRRLLGLALATAFLSGCGSGLEAGGTTAVPGSGAPRQLQQNAIYGTDAEPIRAAVAELEPLTTYVGAGGPGTANYTLSGDGDYLVPYGNGNERLTNQDRGFYVDDIVRLSMNGTVIYTSPTFNRVQRVIFSARPGAVMLLEALDTGGYAHTISRVSLFDANGSRIQNVLEGFSEYIIDRGSGSLTPYATANFTIAGRNVRIEDWKPEPSSFNPEAGETCTLTGRVITEGFTNPTATHVVTIRKTEGEAVNQRMVAAAANIDPLPNPTPSPVSSPFHAFNITGTLQLGGDGTGNVSVPWDGKYPGTNQTVPPDDYKAYLTVTVDEAGGGFRQNVTANTTVTVGGGTVLEVRQGNTVIATSDPNGVGGKTQRDLLQRVCLRSNGNLTVELRNVPDQAASHRVDVGPAHSPLVLQRVQQTSTYRAQTTVADLVLVPQTNSFTITDAHRGLVSGNPAIDPASAALTALNGLSFQLKGRMILGQIQRASVLTSTTPRTTQTGMPTTLRPPVSPG